MCAESERQRGATTNGAAASQHWRTDWQGGAAAAVILSGHAVRRRPRSPERAQRDSRTRLLPRSQSRCRRVALPCAGNVPAPTFPRPPPRSNGAGKHANHAARRSRPPASARGPSLRRAGSVGGRAAGATPRPTRSRQAAPFAGRPARQNEGREIRTPNLLIWSQTRCRCAIPPCSSKVPVAAAWRLRGGRCLPPLAADGRSRARAWRPASCSGRHRAMLT
jgi:hypothetical protein